MNCDHIKHIAIFVLIVSLLLVGYLFYIKTDRTYIDRYTGRFKVVTSIGPYILQTQEPSQGLVPHMQKAGLTVPPPGWVFLHSHSMSMRAQGVGRSYLPLTYLQRMLDNNFLVIDDAAKAQLLQAMLDHLQAGGEIQTISGDKYFEISADGKLLGKFPTDY